jgi:hypothetical protein
MLRVETMVKLTLQDLKMFWGPYEERLSVIHSYMCETSSSSNSIQIGDCHLGAPICRVPKLDGDFLAPISHCSQIDLACRGI